MDYGQLHTILYKAFLSVSVSVSGGVNLFGQYYVIQLDRDLSCNLDRWWLPTDKSTRV